MGKILNQINDILQSEVIYPSVSILLDLSNVICLSVNTVAEKTASVNSVQSLSKLSVSYFISSISGGASRPLSLIYNSPPLEGYGEAGGWVSVHYCNHLYILFLTCRRSAVLLPDVFDILYLIFDITSFYHKLIYQTSNKLSTLNHKGLKKWLH
jgi:hypothetical protein